MNEHLRYSSEPRSRSLTLPALVSEETMLRALFNYYGSSMPLSDGNAFHNIHWSHIPWGREFNIVIVDTMRKRKTGRYHVWSFGTFEGPDLSECNTDEAQKKFMDQITKIIKHNRVAGSTLEQRLQEVIKGFYD